MQVFIIYFFVTDIGNNKTHKEQENLEPHITQTYVNEEFEIVTVLLS